MSATMDNRDGYIWFNGELIEWKKTTIHPLTHGLHYASCVFEGERAYNGKIFKSHEHNLRLKNSAEMLDFTIPYDIEDFEKAKYEVLKANNLKDAYIRQFAWLGSDALGLLGTGIGVNYAVAAWEWGAYFGDNHPGLNLGRAKFARPSPDTAPVAAKASGLYMICTISKNNVTKAGYDDALMLDYRGYIAETTAANIFFVMGDGSIHTPLPDAFLNGITRQTAIEIAHNMGIEVVQRHIKPEEMATAVECFVTGSAAEIQPVLKIWDTYEFKNDNIAPKIINAYKDLVNS